jgi:hypothetical protein
MIRDGARDCKEKTPKNGDFPRFFWVHLFRDRIFAGFSSVREPFAGTGELLKREPTPVEKDAWDLP